MYYRLTNKFHAKEIPKTNYDCIKEEKLELDGFTEQEMLAKISSEYANLLSQQETNTLEKEFSIAPVNLYDVNGSPGIVTNPPLVATKDNEEEKKSPDEEEKAQQKK